MYLIVFISSCCPVKALIREATDGPVDTALNAEITHVLLLHLRGSQARMVTNTLIQPLAATQWELSRSYLYSKPPRGGTRGSWRTRFSS